MQKLIEKFLANPTDANKEALWNYSLMHPMAIGMVDNETKGKLSAHGVRL